MERNRHWHGGLNVLQQPDILLGMTSFVKWLKKSESDVLKTSTIHQSNSSFTLLLVKNGFHGSFTVILNYSQCMVCPLRQHGLKGPHRKYLITGLQSFFELCRKKMFALRIFTIWMKRVSLLERLPNHTSSSIKVSALVFKPRLVAKNGSQLWNAFALMVVSYLLSPFLKGKNH